MKNKKKIILDAARLLFNEKGYSQVTIRMIATKLGMSSGNLNYHFKKRESIFEALYFEMVAEFDSRIENLPHTDLSFAYIKKEIEGSMERMTDYTFFWTDLYNVLSISERVNTHFQNAHINRINGCHQLFEQLIAKGLMKAPGFPKEHNFLAERMVGYGNTWLYASRLYSSNQTKNELRHAVNTYLSIFVPYLTTEGRVALQHETVGFFE